MSILKDKERERVGKILGDLENDVKLVMFGKEGCEHCRVTKELVEELGQLVDKVTAEVHDLASEGDLAKKYGVDKTPAIIVLGDRDYGIRFYGVPAGHEFATLLEDIRDVGRRDPKLTDEMMAQLAKVDKPVHMQVMVLLTCPYCPKAVRTAHRFAMASEHITGDMIDAAEFPDLAEKYSVKGVPKTIINENTIVVGAEPEKEFAKKVLEAIGK